MFRFIRVEKSIITAIVGCGLLLSLACDGAIRVKGKVYARKASKGYSEAFIDESSPDSSQLIPVKDAQITLYHGGDYSQQSINKSTPWRDTDKTDASGTFVLGGMTAPYRFHAALVVEKEGYKSLTKIFLHDKVAHEAVIILEPNEAIAK